MQIERVRQQQLAKERKRQAEVAAKAQKLKKDRHVQDVLQRQAVLTESTLGTSDQQWRASTDLVRKAEERVQHETELAMHLANREIADAVYRAHDAELARLGTEKWARGMQTGAQEFALERAGWTISERKSLRDFGWVKADIRQEEQFRRATQELLPTGPGALSHQQTPGAWRPDRLSMSPGAWASAPVQVTVERAQTAQMHSHGRNMRALIQRREFREKTLDMWDQVGTKVADTRYEAWRIKKKVKVEELVRSWDRNGDGVINKNEFRIAVRGYGFKEINVLEIDGLFDKIDNDKSGELDLSEIKAALKKLQERAQNLGASIDQEQAKAAALIGVAQVFQTAAAATAEYEAAQQKAAQMKDNPSLGKRVGDAILKRNVKLGELVGQWDKDGNGVVDKKEFREQIHLMGIKEIHPREMDSLFVSLDRNGDGSLDLDELKVALQLLRDTAVREALDVEAQASAALKLCVASRKQQKVRQEQPQRVIS